MKEGWRVVLAGERQMLADLTEGQAATLSKLMIRCLGSLRPRED